MYCKILNYIILTWQGQSAVDLFRIISQHIKAA